MRLDMSRPVLMTHLTPLDCKSPMSCCSSAGIGGFSNSAKSVPSKSVEISFMGRNIVGARCVKTGPDGRACCPQRAVFHALRLTHLRNRKIMVRYVCLVNVRLHVLAS